MIPRIKAFWLSVWSPSPNILSFKNYCVNETFKVSVIHAALPPRESCGYYTNSLLNVNIHPLQDGGCFEPRLFQVKLLWTFLYRFPCKRKFSSLLCTWPRVVLPCDWSMWSCRAVFQDIVSARRGLRMRAVVLSASQASPYTEVLTFVFRVAGDVGIFSGVCH